MTHNMFWLFLLPLAVAAQSACPAGECFTSTGCVESVYGARCVECSARGYLDGSACVCYPALAPLDPDTCAFVHAPAQSVPSVCPAGRCEYAPGLCAPSTDLVRCLECNEQGYLVDALVDGVYAVRSCRCFDPVAYSSAIACVGIYNVSSVATLVAAQSRATITPHDSRELGCFELVGQPTNYGEPYDLTFKCCVEALGPAPQAYLASSGLGHLGECNAYVARDPDAAPCVTAEGLDCRDAVVCGGHGRWNAELYRCECFERWGLAPTGLVGPTYDPDGEAETHACTVCSGWWGPSLSPDACSAPYTPDPVTGADAVCGGNGVYERGRCACYQSDADGWWDLAVVTGEFERLVYVDGVVETERYEASVATCAICSRGAGPPPGSENPCSTMVFAPTAAPTSAPTVPSRLTLRELVVGNATFDWQPTECGEGFYRVVESDGVAIADLARAWGFRDDVPVVSVDGVLIAATYELFALGVLNASVATVTNATGWWAAPCGNSTTGVARLANVTDQTGEYDAGCVDALAQLCVGE